MSKAVDAYLLNEMQIREDHELIFSVEHEANGIIIDALSSTQSMNENLNELFPPVQKFTIVDEDYELQKIKEEQDKLDEEMLAAGIGVEE